MRPQSDYLPTVSDTLAGLVNAGTLTDDPAQRMVARGLDRVLARIRTERPASKSSALGWLFASKKAQDPLKGLYIFGQVGRGKTMLMDAFYSLLPASSKRRAHFHEFMADVHARIHAHRQKLKEGLTRQADPVPPVADSLVAQARYLCFDEFSVTDIADAMILSRLFNALFERGAVLVATSNVAPDDLYRDGLNRALFTPFIGSLKDHVDVLSLDSPTDYRMEKLDRVPVWMTPLDPATAARFEAAWSEAVSGQRVASSEIAMKGRSVRVPLAAGRTARFSFADLCESPLGPSDYLAIADRFDTVFLESVPLLSPEKRNETKRFINLIDTFYDRGLRLFASAAAAPDGLLVVRKGTEGFEFDRTVSRLFEMGSTEWRARRAESASKV